MSDESDFDLRPDQWEALKALRAPFAGLPASTRWALDDLVALVELVGGILFALGIASRLTSLVLFVNMTMAYLSVPDDRVNFSHIFSKPDDFYGAGPYTYWFAALLILILGPGKYAIDALIQRFSPQRERAHIHA